jgi:hypothetical protein
MRGVESNPYQSPQEPGYELPVQPRIERGGLRWGESFWIAKNATWPFATFTVRANYLEVICAVPFPLGIFDATFIFTPSDVSELRIIWGLFSRGVHIKHRREDYPPFIVFWSFSASRVLASAGAAGFRIVN